MKTYSLKIETFFINMDYLYGLTKVLRTLNVTFEFTQLQEDRRNKGSVQKLEFTCDDRCIKCITELLDGIKKDIYETESTSKLFGGFKDVRKHPISDFDFSIEEIKT